jgi:hypothetical protein
MQVLPCQFEADAAGLSDSPQTAVILPVTPLLAAALASPQRLSRFTAPLISLSIRRSLAFAIVCSVQGWTRSVACRLTQHSSAIW